jgi:hypothetical protein
MILKFNKVMNTERVTGKDDIQANVLPQYVSFIWIQIFQVYSTYMDK